MMALLEYSMPAGILRLDGAFVLQNLLHGGIERLRLGDARQAALGRIGERHGRLAIRQAEIDEEGRVLDLDGQGPPRAPQPAL